MNDSSSRTYTSDDVDRIIRRALKIEQSESITHRELLETAQELGIDPRKIEAAINEEAAGMERERFRKEYMIRKRSKFHAHLWTYIIVNTALFIINWATPGSWWFQWVLLFWGMGLALRFRKAYFPTLDRIEKAERRIMRRQRRLQMIHSHHSYRRR